jgi:Transposase zinc-ribbon domain
MPVAGVDYPRTYQEFLAWFPDERSCVDYLERVRWPDGFACPACGHDRFWRTGDRLRMCARCGRKTSVTTGTNFHRSHTPLTTWFAAIWFVMSQKNGISALGLQRVLKREALDSPRIKTSRNTEYGGSAMLRALMTPARRTFELASSARLPCQLAATLAACGGADDGGSASPTYRSVAPRSDDIGRRAATRQTPILSSEAP